MRIKLFLATLVAGFAIVAGVVGPAAQAHTTSCTHGTAYRTINGVLFKDVYTGYHYDLYTRQHVHHYDTFKRIDVYYYYVHTHYRACPYVI